VTASFHGDEPAIAFNPHYLLDGLAAAAAGSGQARNQAPTGSEGRDGAGEQVSAAVTIRLEFTSPAKPALITLAGGTDGTARQAGEEADAAPGEADSGADGATGTPASGPAAPRPGFRYLVVPLRSPARS
jgi:hypothetical protein